MKNIKEINKYNKKTTQPKIITLSNFRLLYKLSIDKHSLITINNTSTITCTDKLNQLSMIQKVADVVRPCELSFQEIAQMQAQTSSDGES